MIHNELITLKSVRNLQDWSASGNAYYNNIEICSIVCLFSNKIENLDWLFKMVLIYIEEEVKKHLENLGFDKDNSNFREVFNIFTEDKNNYIFFNELPLDKKILVI